MIKCAAGSIETIFYYCHLFGGALSGFFPKTTMDLLHIIKARRSVRRFQQAPFAEELLNQVLEAGQYAPSAGNVQPWRFFVVRNGEKLQQLADAALGQTWILSAPLVIVVCADLARSQTSYGRRGSELYALQDSAAAIQNMLLTVTSVGLAACWVGAFREELAARVVGVDGKNMRPVALIPIGYAAEPAAAPQKRPLEEIVEYMD